ncbi:hypothetical protein GCG54_00007666 [Colletotrichum gloeosporioides]|uniref:Uncharacterized protein n=1 Tax=Colletotrichum gloeosporioides TaxID=474922 RepID=A0A8H4CPZ9_COLGL|nr:uncharacterized protein GCG54_00007666 [Colletotrichum gloeosporioides]KAF3807930.1 hypothetical protein GCG54_00007666 [Colletotrichum gloeosporioides]
MDELTDAFYHWRLAAPGYNRLLKIICPKYLSRKEADDIMCQFNEIWVNDKQVLWSGVDHDLAEEWAEQRGMQTLTCAMGPLMNWTHPKCRRIYKSSVQWTRYMKGVSAIFAWKIAQGQTTTLLTPPPPVRFHPSGLTNYQDIERPILKGAVDGVAVGKIVVVHPEVDGAEDMAYEYWPKDHVAKWYANYGSKKHGTTRWRKISATIWPTKVDKHPEPSRTETTGEMEAFLVTGLHLFVAGCIHLVASYGILVYYFASTLYPRNRGYSRVHDKPIRLIITQRSDVDLDVNVEEAAEPAALLLSVPRSSPMKTDESVMDGVKRLRCTDVHRYSTNGGKGNKMKRLKCRQRWGPKDKIDSMRN